MWKMIRIGELVPGDIVMWSAMRTSLIVSVQREKLRHGNEAIRMVYIDTDGCMPRVNSWAPSLQVNVMRDGD